MAKKFSNDEKQIKPLFSGDLRAKNLGMLPRTKKEIEAAAAEEAALQD